jgi:hypothetical protein
LICSTNGSADLFLKLCMDWQEGCLNNKDKNEKMFDRNIAAMS